MSDVKHRIAERAARDIESGWYVNLGVGLPTRISEFVDPDKEIVFHSENGILGMGPSPGDDAFDPWLVNASKKAVTLRPGAALFHHADSFTMIRGGHIDLCALGGYQVTPGGDLANWTTPTGDVLPAVGGAMDLAVGAKRIWVLMEHTSRKGHIKLVNRCTYPLTAPGCVTRVYTDLGVFAPEGDGFRVLDLSDGVALDEVQAKTEAPVLG